jgi:hypothetical protein
MDWVNLLLVFTIKERKGMYNTIEKGTKKARLNTVCDHYANAANVQRQ